MDRMTTTLETGRKYQENVIGRNHMYFDIVSTEFYQMGLVDDESTVHLLLPNR